MLQCWYNGQADLRRGDILKISRAIIEGSSRYRITTFENLTSGSPYRSQDEGTTMTVSPREIIPPIIGMVSKIVSRTDGRMELQLKQIKSGIPVFLEGGALGIHVFISSAMDELKYEREKTALAICESGFIPIYFEKFKPDEKPAQKMMIDELKKCHIYVGIFAEKYSEATIIEFEEAKNLGIPKMIFIKRVEKRETGLDDFIQKLKSEKGLTYKPFETPQELEALLRAHLLEAANGLFIN